VVSHLLVGTFREAYLPIPTKEIVRRAADSLWPALSPIALRRNLKYSMTDHRAYVGFDVMSKLAPGTPGLSNGLFIGFGTGECWNSH